jgi:hypothetical protein
MIAALQKRFQPWISFLILVLISPSRDMQVHRIKVRIFLTLKTTCPILLWTIKQASLPRQLLPRDRWSQIVTLTCSLWCQLSNRTVSSPIPTIHMWYSHSKCLCISSKMQLMRQTKIESTTCNTSSMSFTINRLLLSRCRLAWWECKREINTCSMWRSKKDCRSYNKTRLISPLARSLIYNRSDFNFYY